MSNKKYLAYFANSADYDINHILVGNPLLLNKLCKSFEKVYLIGFQNLVFFPPKKNKPILNLIKNWNYQKIWNFFAHLIGELFQTLWLIKI